jgi:membrane protein DedA with SNARE-associated domain
MILGSMSGDEAERRARERTEAILGLISLVIWLAVAFSLAITLGVDEDHPEPTLMAGGVALVIAAVPWLAYRWLLERSRRRQMRGQR